MLSKIIQNPEGEPQHIAILGDFQLIFTHVRLLQIIEVHEQIRLVTVLH